jgi:hypothetical protein
VPQSYQSSTNAGQRIGQKQKGLCLSQNQYALESIKNWPCSIHQCFNALPCDVKRTSDEGSLVVSAVLIGNLHSKKQSKSRRLRKDLGDISALSSSLLSRVTTSWIRAPRSTTGGRVSSLVAITSFPGHARRMNCTWLSEIGGIVLLN